MKKLNVFILVLVLLLLPQVCLGDITLRAGMALPQGDFKELAATGWSVDVVADVHPFSLEYLSVPVLVNVSGYGKQEIKYTSIAPSVGEVTQASTITLTGGGIGLKLEPSRPVFKPFIEVLGRLASIEQEYDSGIAGEKSVIESKTKLGFQVNGGLKYNVTPTTSLQAGVGYTILLKANLKNENIDQELDTRSLGIFVGASFNLDW